MTAKARSLKQAAKKLTAPKPKKRMQVASEASLKPAADERKEGGCSWILSL